MPHAVKLRLLIGRGDGWMGLRLLGRLGAGIGFAAGALGTVIFCSGNRNEFSDEGKCEVYGRDFTLMATGLVGAAGGIVGVVIGYA